MVFVKVRETYDLHTVKNKMTVVAIHTPKPAIIKKNFPGLLMQCKAYRPYSCDVRIACASVLPLDPKGVGTTENDVAPEDVFNPILYKAMSNKGMSQLEGRINYISKQTASGTDIQGSTASVDVDSVTSSADEFGIYYGLLSNAHGWRHASPQKGLEMTNLKPLVYDILYNVGDCMTDGGSTQIGNMAFQVPGPDGDKASLYAEGILGSAHPMPFINCTSYTKDSTKTDIGYASPGFPSSDVGYIDQCSLDVPWINCVVAGICIPPSRLHELYYRMVVEWTIEFTSIRPLGEITDWAGLGRLGDQTHYKNYNYSESKRVVTGDDSTILENDSCMVSANVDINQVM